MGILRVRATTLGGPSFVNLFLKNSLLLGRPNPGRTIVNKVAAQTQKSPRGARNPYQILEKWGSYVEVMDPIREFLLKAIRSTEELQNLAGACGDQPSRSPPAAKVVSRLRVRLGKLLGLSKTQTTARHPASPWFYNLVKKIQEGAEDPDVEVHRWLREGAPFGIGEEVRPGGLLPLIEEQAELSAEMLLEQDKFEKNHGSFDEVVDGHKPAMAELCELVDNGFARIFKDRVVNWELLKHQLVARK